MQKYFAFQAPLALPSINEAADSRRGTAATLEAPQRLMREFDLGDRVIVHVSLVELQELQTGEYGGFNAMMNTLPGKIGTVIDPLDEQRIEVKFDKHLVWTLNPRCLSQYF